MTADELDSTLSRLFDRDLSPEEFTKLEQYLISSAAARLHYREYVDLHNCLDLTFFASSPTQLGVSKIVPIERIVHRQQRRSFRIAACAAAALVLIGLFTMQLFFVEDRAPSLTFQAAPGTRYTLTHTNSADNTPEGTILENGSHLQLSQGTIELTFANGVKSIVTAPADITLHTSDTLYMNQGIAWFHVPPQAIGFRVKTTDLDILDLGTEFGVIVTPDNYDEVHVIKGKVRVTALRVRKDSHTIAAGEARRIDVIGRLDTIPATPSVFLTHLPQSLPYLHWSFDEVESGGFPADGHSAFLELGFAIPKNAHASSMQIPGRFGKAIRFTGKPGEEILTEWPGISGNKPRTIACWIRIAPQSLNPNGTSIAVWGENKDGYPGWPSKWKLAISPDGKPTAVGYDGAVEGSPNVADNQWHHIACTHEMNAQGKPVVTMFVDGQRVENIWLPRKRPLTDVPTTIVAPNTKTTGGRSHPLQFGKSLNNSAPIRADLDEIYIFEGALDAQIIQRLATDNQHQP